MICNHEEAEKDVALIDGYCPLCLSVELATLTALLKEAREALEPLSDIYNGKNPVTKCGDYILNRDSIRRAAEIRKKIQEATNGL